MTARLGREQIGEGGTGDRGGGGGAVTEWSTLHRMLLSLNHMFCAQDEPPTLMLKLYASVMSEHEVKENRANACG